MPISNSQRLKVKMCAPLPTHIFIKMIIYKVQCDVMEYSYNGEWLNQTGRLLFAVLEVELRASNMLGKHWPLNCVLSLMKRVVQLVTANNCPVEPGISVLLCAYFRQAHLSQATHCVHELFHALPNWGVAFIHRGQTRMLSSVLLYTLWLFSLRQDFSPGLDLGWQASSLRNLPLQHWGYRSIWQHPVFYMSSGDLNSDP